jgi:hypothetical protein
LTAFEEDMEFEERRFQQKLDSMFPATHKVPAPTLANQNVFCHPKRSDGGDEGPEKGHCTAKKRQMDAHLEELEKHFLLETKKKYNSPGRSNKSKNNQDRPGLPFQESIISRKKGVFFNQNNHDNGGRSAGGVPAIFNDQLEELLNREQKILEQRSMKAFEGNFGKKNDLRIKNSVYEGIGGSDNIISSEASKFKNSSTQRGVDGNSLGDLEVLPQTIFRINRFQATKMADEAVNRQGYGGQKY